MDVLIFGGQSNMAGLTGEPPKENDAVDGALEYRFLTDELIPLKNPVGEDWDVMLQKSIGDGGSLLPSFCREYIKATGRNVVAIHAARGSTTVGEWQKGTQRFFYMLQKLKRGIEKAREISEIENVYYIWLQGEGDAIIGTTEDEYVQSIIKYKNAIKKEIPIDRFCIIRVGYFYCTSQWHSHIGTYEERKQNDEAIMRAQDRVIYEDEDFVMLTDVCAELSLDKRFINPEQSGHYNNEALEIIGSEAGKALGKNIKN